VSAERAATPVRRPAVAVPEGWKLREASGPRPFVTRATFERPDGSVVEWTSRRHRKRLGLRRLHGRRFAGARRGASASSLAMGGLFMIGSFCFALGSIPAYSDHVSVATVGWTFFVGSIFFTSAAFLQFHEAMTAPEAAGDAPAPHEQRIAAWAPHRIDWWSSAIQFVGTLAFNVTTFAATRTSLTVAQDRRWVWVPDVVGSICFLLSSWLAFVEAGAGEHGFRHRSVGWWISSLNLVGSIAFGFAAVAGRYIHSTGEIANIAVVNLGTFAGAVCFFGGAALLPVESARG
jgi:hypothetical protein